MRENGLLFLNRQEVRECIPEMKQMISIVRDVFVAHALGNDIMPPGAFMDIEGVVGHMASSQAYLNTKDIEIAGMKWISRYVNNQNKYGIPTLTSLIILNDVNTGVPVCIMEGSLITAVRTGAASALGSIFLANRNSKNLSVIGASIMAEYQIKGLSAVCNFDKIKIFDIERENAEKLAKNISNELGLSVKVCGSLPEVSKESDIIVTATSSSSPFLSASMLEPGVLVISIGSKPEVCSDVFCIVNKVVPDTVGKCKKLGSLVPFFRVGSEGIKIHAEIGNIVLGEKPGRESNNEIILYVPMGMATEDIASAYHVYLEAKGRKKGILIGFP